MLSCSYNSQVCNLHFTLSEVSQQARCHHWPTQFRLCQACKNNKSRFYQGTSKASQTCKMGGIPPLRDAVPMQLTSHSASPGCSDSQSTQLLIGVLTEAAKRRRESGLFALSRSPLLSLTYLLPSSFSSHEISFRFSYLHFSDICSIMAAGMVFRCFLLSRLSNLLSLSFTDLCFSLTNLFLKAKATWRSMHPAFCGICTYYPIYPSNSTLTLPSRPNLAPIWRLG